MAILVWGCLSDLTCEKIYMSVARNLRCNVENVPPQTGQASWYLQFSLVIISSERELYYRHLAPKFSSQIISMFEYVLHSMKRILRVFVKVCTSFDVRWNLPACCCLSWWRNAQVCMYKPSSWVINRTVVCRIYLHVDTIAHEASLVR